MQRVAPPRPTRGREAAEPFGGSQRKKQDSVPQGGQHPSRTTEPEESLASWAEESLEGETRERKGPKKRMLRREGEERRKRWETPRLPPTPPHLLQGLIPFYLFCPEMEQPLPNFTPCILSNLSSPSVNL